MKTIYLIRHGQTDSNVAGVLGTAKDPLSQKGMQQAKQVGERFRDVSFDGIISSPYVRAHQTAEAIAAHKNRPIEVSGLFIEVRSPKELEGKGVNAKEILHIKKLRHDNWANKDYHYSTEENFHDSNVRAEKALDFLAHRPEKTLVVASHGAFMRTMVGRILLGSYFTAEVTGILRYSMVTSNTGVTVLTYEEDKWKLVRWNDTIHLEPELESW